MYYLFRGSLLLPLFVLIVMTGCSPKYDYRIHKPKVVYKKPTKKALKTSLKENLGKKYVWAEEGPKAFDCSGLTYYCYGRMNLEIPRVSREQAQGGTEISSDTLQYGDLVFFDTKRAFTGTVTHVGVYIGNGKFQHASSSKEGVIISSLDDGYYKKRFITARRYLVDEAVSTPTRTTVAAHTAKPHKPKVSTATPIVIAQNTPRPSRGRHYIQVGSFSKRPGSALIQKINSQGLTYTIKTVTVGERKLNKLLIGPFADKAMLLRSLSSVRAKIVSEAFAVTI